MSAVSRQALFKIFLLTSAYFGAGRLGLLLPYVGSHITLIWLPSGIAVAALLRWGYRFWPGVFCGALTVNFSIEPSLSLSTGIALGDTVGPLLSAWLLNRLQFDANLARLRDSALLAGAAAIGVAATAGNGVTCLFLAGSVPAEKAAAAWLGWWAGGWIGVLLATPLLLSVSRVELARLWRQRREFLIWLVVSGGLGWTVFFLDADSSGDSLPLLFIMPALLVWAAMSFGLTGSSLGVIVQVAVAAVATHQGIGPFHRADIREGSFLLWLYLATLIFVQLLVAALQSRRNRAELELRASENRYRTIIEHLSASIAVHTDDKIVYVNDACRKMLGAANAEQLIGRPVLEFVHADDREMVARAIEEGLRNIGLPPSELPALEERLIKLDGSAIVVEASAIIIDYGGKPAFMVTMHDITQRKQAERMQREAGEKMQYMIATSPTILFASQMQNNRLTTHWISDNLSRILGYSIDEALRPDWWRAHIHPDDRERVLNESAVLFGGKQQAYEYRFMHKSGAVLWMRDEQQLSYDDKGRLVEVLSAWTDITERKHEELELRIAATAFETQEAIVITDQDNRILRTNRAFTRLTGYSAEEAIGKTPSLFKSGRQDAVFYKRMWEAIERDRHWEGEIWNRRKNGEIYPEWLNITAIPDTTGKITRYVATFSDITQMKKSEAEIHALAFYDPLTQLPNRRLLYDRIGHALAVSSRSGLHGALIFLDLDHFKVLNDTQGHAVGDQLLIEAAQRLMVLLREIDTVARLGGDEFVAMLEDLSEDPVLAAEQARAVAEKIGKSLAEPYQLWPNHDQDGNLPIEHYSSASIGVTLFRDDESDIDELMKRADLAMYQAKRSGRNAVCFFDPLMQSALLGRSELEKDLRSALDNHEFCLHYQLQVDSEHRPISAEALLRWQHPMRGNVPPEEFIPLAEENGLITAIGKWVLIEACKTLAKWALSPELRDLELAVNVSARQFNQPDFVEQVRSALQTTGANPERLKLEITESLVLHNLEDTINKMLAAKELGVNFAMDDFGTGYSSLSYLQQLPLEQLKIDRSFIRDLHGDSYDAAIVRTILTLGKTLEITTIAEGVETQSQHSYLTEHGCPVFQGFLYGKPMPLQEFEARILEIKRGESSPSEPPISEEN